MSTEKRTAEMRSIMGEARTFAEFLQSFTQKHVIAFALLDPLLIFYGMATLESKAWVGLAFFGMATVLTVAFMLCSCVKRSAAIKAQAMEKQP